MMPKENCELSHDMAITIPADSCFLDLFGDWGSLRKLKNFSVVIFQPCALGMHLIITQTKQLEHRRDSSI